MSENPNCARCGFPKSEHRLGYSRSRCQFDVIPTSPSPGASAGREELDIVRVARDEISRICAGRGGTTRDGRAGGSWRMSIPVQSYDSDEIFTRLANECESLRSALAAERAAGAAMRDHIQRALDAVTMERMLGHLRAARALTAECGPGGGPYCCKDA